MKWDKPNGSVQWSADKRYLIVQANSQHWVAYEATPFVTATDLGTKGTDAEARGLCEEHEATLVALRKRA
jgi:hypothetical protein